MAFWHDFKPKNNKEAARTPVPDASTWEEGSDITRDAAPYIGISVEGL